MDHKKNIFFLIIIFLIISSCIGLFLFFGIDYVDCFEKIDIEFSGLNGNGNAKIIYIDEQKKDDIFNFKIEPNESLSNDDVIKVKVENTKFELLKHKILLKDTEKEYIVSGLKNSKFTYQNEPKNSQSSVEDEKKYEEYWKNKYCEDCENENVEIDENEEENGTAPLTQEWSKGESETETNRKDSEFYVVDYGNNAIETFKQANTYGMESSQEYKVEPIVNSNGKNIGYSCIFNN